MYIPSPSWQNQQRNKRPRAFQPVEILGMAESDPAPTWGELMSIDEVPDGWRIHAALTSRTMRGLFSPCGGIVANFLADITRYGRKAAIPAFVWKKLRKLAFEEITPELIRRREAWRQRGLKEAHRRRAAESFLRSTMKKYGEADARR